MISTDEPGPAPAPRAGIDRAAALARITCDPREIPALLAEAEAARRAVFGDAVRLCAISNARSGSCPERCDFCAQGAAACAPLPPTPLKAPEVIAAEARAAEAAGAREFSIVTSGRGLHRERDVAALEQAVRLIRAQTSLQACASLGEVDAAVLARLRAAGLQRYHHNLEAAPSFHGRVVHSHSFEDEVAVVLAARRAGLKTCCGGVLGMGESLAQRVELAFALKALGPDCVPLNFLDPRPGTPLQDRAPLPPLECLRIVAVFRLVLPETHLFVCGGRERSLGPQQHRIFAAGATGALVGDYLTTRGQSPAQDRQMIAAAGFRLER